MCNYSYFLLAAPLLALAFTYTNSAKPPENGYPTQMQESLEIISTLHGNLLKGLPKEIDAEMQGIIKAFGADPDIPMPGKDTQPQEDYAGLLASEVYGRETKRYKLNNTKTSQNNVTAVDSKRGKPEVIEANYKPKSQKINVPSTKTYYDKNSMDLGEG